MREEVLWIDDFKIVLPIGLPTVLETPVRDSYQEFLKDSTKDVRRHLTAVCKLLPPVIKDTHASSFLHAFGGVGATAQVINQVVKGARHTFWDRDPVLAEYLSNKFDQDEVVHVQDSFEMLQQLSMNELDQYDALLLDMSVGTIKTPGVKDTWKTVSDWMQGNRFAWFTDTACHKIHLNYKTYTKDFGKNIEPNAFSYLNAYSEWLENTHRLTITAAMREAGEYYCVVRSSDFMRFATIPYL